ncbi:MAG: HAMP domain-containing histidine kinase [Planctomycetes bacterium]|nr:HAMP domain-containing histidine kinase [Planctomycetota bacterium]
MQLRGLRWRIGLPFVGLGLAGSVLLAALLAVRNQQHSQTAFVRLALTNADFVREAGLIKPWTRLRGNPEPGDQTSLATQLRRVHGVEVWFRYRQVLEPPTEAGWQALLAAVPADREVHAVGADEVVAVPLTGTLFDLLCARPRTTWWHGLWRVDTVALLAAFWLSSLLVVWWTTRGLVRPLRQLAARLPEIEGPTPLDLPAASRADEIGDLARAFLRTRAALQLAREQGQRAEQLALLGRMTAALAHEIQNPVAAIKMHAQLWQGAADDDTAAIIEHEAARIEDLLNQWLYLCRPEPPALRELAVHEMLVQVIAAHRAQLEHALVQVELDADPGLQVQGDGKRLMQVCSSLLVNAIQAMPGGGRLAIAARRHEDRCRLTFADSGRGFSATALARLGEFFFSEKEGGMGIGLGVARGIVQAHGGTLQAANRPAGGAIVTVDLPLRPGPGQGVASGGGPR